MTNHNPRCAIFHDPPSLRDPSDCNCGAIPRFSPGHRIEVLEDALQRIRREAYAGNLDRVYAIADHALSKDQP